MEDMIKSLESEKAKLTTAIEELNKQIFDLKAQRKKLEKALDLLKK